uniref:SFRICE_018586 n=1 Tax=Spodoptera frugiperda TaxID=7108 RepID=A0A2H1V1C1_SPOFR
MTHMKWKIIPFWKEDYGLPPAEEPRRSIHNPWNLQSCSKTSSSTRYSFIVAGGTTALDKKCNRERTEEYLGDVVASATTGFGSTRYYPQPMGPLKQ